MAFKVTFSSRAENNLDDIVAYLEMEWSTKVKENFLALLKEKIKFISENPGMYQASAKRKSIRRCVVGDQNILYYKIKKDEVEIITIQDGRKNPKWLKL
jgi:plasmid stabilization system protein ParE